jgi:phosphohistidine phosphatase
MNLYLLRHANAGTRRANPLLDIKRPIDKEGKQQCLHLAQVLNALKVSFDVVVSSPLKRSLQTAQLLATETGYEAPVQLSTGLAPEATVADFQKLLAELEGYENVLVVGHSPNLQMFAGSLLAPARAAASAIPRIRMRKGTLARIALGGPAPVLLGLLDPRVARALYATSTKSSRRKTSRK